MVEDDLIGVVVVVRREAEPFTDDHIALVQTFADQAAIALTNARLFEAVERQRTELSRFVSPQVADLVSSEHGDPLLAGHRAYISSLFCDLRGFTAFVETAAPEELFDVLREYHAVLGDLIPVYEGTLEHFAGDGVMVFFNDPLPVDEHELQAIRLALAAQGRFTELAGAWRKRGIDLALGIGIEAGYATLGRIGFEGRFDYAALGPATNLASRLSTYASAGQTLIGQRIFAATEEAVETTPVGTLDLKGFGRPVVAYEVQRLRERPG
jgi:adenylate cyclase